MSIATEIARLQQAKADLKTAINAKGRAITDEPLDEYAAEVDAIEVGGGGTPSFDVKKQHLIRFIDYTGELLYVTRVNTGEDVTPPAEPDHTDIGLTFQEWNQTSSNITAGKEIGATYVTTDGKTHMVIDLNNAGVPDLIVSLMIEKSNSDELSVDWGDGSAISTYTHKTYATITHTYSNYGRYEITMWMSSGTTGTYSFGRKYQSLTYLLGNESRNRSLISFFGGLRLIYVNSGTFRYCYSLEYITLPYGVLLGDQLYQPGQFENCESLRAIVIPNKENTSALPAGLFRYCYALQRLSIPDSYSIGGADRYSNIFNECNSVERICSKYLSITDLMTIFYGCHSLSEVSPPIEMSTLGSSQGSSNTNFSLCHSLFRHVYIGSSTKYFIIGNNVFQNAPPISVEVACSGNFCGSNSFAGSSNQLSKIIISYQNSDWTQTYNNPLTVTNHGLSTMYHKIFVPDSYTETYKAATNWVTLKTIIFPLSQLHDWSLITLSTDGADQVYLPRNGKVGAVSTAPNPAPTKTGFTFDGWYTDTELTTPFTFGVDVYPTENITLYAKWV